MGFVCMCFPCHCGIYSALMSAYVCSGQCLPVSHKGLQLVESCKVHGDICFSSGSLTSKFDRSCGMLCSSLRQLNLVSFRSMLDFYVAVCFETNGLAPLRVGVRPAEKLQLWLAYQVMTLVYLTQ